MGISTGFFILYLKKMALEHRVFEKIDIFLQNMGMWVVCFLENETVILIKKQNTLIQS